MSLLTYLISYFAFLIKRLPLVFSTGFTRSVGLKGRFKDARYFADLTRTEISKEKWFKSPTSLQFRLMTHVHYTVLISGFLIYIVGGLSVLGLHGIGLVDTADPFVLLTYELLAKAGFAVSSLSLVIGIPYYRYSDWLKKEGVMNRLLTKDELNTEFDVPSKFRPRVWESLIIVSACTGFMTVLHIMAFGG